MFRAFGFPSVKILDGAYHLAVPCVPSLLPLLFLCSVAFESDRALDTAIPTPGGLISWDKQGLSTQTEATHPPFPTATPRFVAEPSIDSLVWDKEQVGTLKPT